jgi:2-polyprenyl-3-methyl-5-hydroxy-6-metoxy-1,4-benzoquinol methylase
MAPLLVQDPPVLPVKDAAFFQAEVAKAGIPASAASSYTSIRVVVRDLYVDLKDVYAKIAADQLTPSQVSVYADTLKISKLDAAIEVRAGLTLFARQLVVEAGASFKLDYQTSQKPSLVIYTRHVQGVLTASILPLANGQPSTQEINLSEEFAKVPAPNGIKIYYRYDPGTGTGSVKTALFRDFSGIDLALLSAPRMLLETTFQLCTILGNRKQETEEEKLLMRSLVTDMLFWILDVGNSALEGAELNLQSAAVLAQLNVTDDSSSVPDLSRNFYVNQFANLVGLVKTYEEQYNRFEDLKNSVEDRKAAATLLLQKEVDSSDFYQALVDQAKNNFANAQDGLLRANAALSQQNTAVESAGIDLNTTMQNWLKEQKIRLALDIISTVLNFAAAIGMAAVGVPAGGGSVAKSIADAEKQVPAINAAEKAYKAGKKQLVDEYLKELNLPQEEFIKLRDQARNLYDALADQIRIKMLYMIQVEGATPVKVNVCSPSVVANGRLRHADAWGHKCP